MGKRRLDQVPFLFNKKSVSNINDLATSKKKRVNCFDFFLKQ